jgi:hypothetical protein
MNTYICEDVDDEDDKWRCQEGERYNQCCQECSQVKNCESRCSYAEWSDCITKKKIEL